MSIFKELNDVKLDVSEFEEIQISDIGQKRIIKKVHKKINSKKLMKQKKKRYFIVAAASFLVASTITLNAAFPTFAEKLPYIGNIFDLFVNDERYIFEEFDKHSTDIGVTKENNGVSITVTNAVYDKENITIAYSIKSEQDLGLRPALFGEMVVEEFGDRYKYSGYSDNYIVEKINDREYAVLYIYELLKGSKPDAIQVTWQGDRVRNLNNVYQFVSGFWSFEFTLDALERKTIKLDSNDVRTVDAGVEVEAIIMTETPIATTIYLSEKVDERLVAQEDEEMRGVQIEYLVSDNLGNKYKYIHFRSTGHSTDFKEGHKSYPRLTLNVIDEEATYIEITPIVTAYKVANPNKDGDGFLEPVTEPYSMVPIKVPLTK